MEILQIILFTITHEEDDDPNSSNAFRSLYMTIKISMHVKQRKKMIFTKYGLIHNPRAHDWLAMEPQNSRLSHPGNDQHIRQSNCLIKIQLRLVTLNVSFTRQISFKNVAMFKTHNLKYQRQ